MSFDVSVYWYDTLARQLLLELYGPSAHIATLPYNGSERNSICGFGMDYTDTGYSPMTGFWRHRNKPLCFTTYLKSLLWANNSFPRKKLPTTLLTPKRHGIIQRKQCVRITPGINTRTFSRIRRVRSSVVGQRTSDDPKDEEVAVYVCSVTQRRSPVLTCSLTPTRQRYLVYTSALCASHQAAATRNTKTVQSPIAHLPFCRRWQV